MELLRALKDCPLAISEIPAGSKFWEPDPERAGYLVRAGLAEPANSVLVPKSRRGLEGLAWDGAEVCIMASGPSITQEQADAVREWCIRKDNRKAVAINTTFRLAPWADVLYACDQRWWTEYLAEVRAAFLGQLWTLDQTMKATPGMHLVQSERLEGLGRKPGVIHQGMSSGYQAINLMWQAGAARLILLGFDCRAEGKLAHWHGDHPPGVNSTQPYQRWKELLAPLAAALIAEGTDVVNLLPRSAVKCFPVADWREELAK